MYLPYVTQKDSHNGIDAQVPVGQQEPESPVYFKTAVKLLAFPYISVVREMIYNKLVEKNATPQHMKTQKPLHGKKGMYTPLGELRCVAVNSGGWSYPRLKYITKGKYIKIYNAILLNGRNADLD